MIKVQTDNIGKKSGVNFKESLDVDRFIGFNTEYEFGMLLRQLGAGKQLRQSSVDRK